MARRHAPFEIDQLMNNVQNTMDRTMKTMNNIEHDIDRTMDKADLKIDRAMNNVNRDIERAIRSKDIAARYEEELKDYDFLKESPRRNRNFINILLVCILIWVLIAVVYFVTPPLFKSKEPNVKPLNPPAIEEKSTQPTPQNNQL